MAVADDRNRIPLTISDDMLKAIEIASDAFGVNRTAVVMMALTEGMPQVFNRAIQMRNTMRAITSTEARLPNKKR